MKFKLSLFLSFIAVLGLLASSNSFALAQTVTDNSHYYPYTKHLADDYHLRLDVHHNESKLALVFADVSEKAVRLVSFKSIDGEVILPGGETKKVKLTAVNKKSYRTKREPLVSRLVKRKAGEYEVVADWIRTTPNFSLVVSFPFEGKDYKFVFEYTIGRQILPHHRKE
jgi:hypothetical protein